MIVYNRDNNRIVKKGRAFELNIREMSREQLAEESNIDIAYAVLAEKGENLTLRQLMDEVRKLNGVTVRAMADNLHRINTDINIDGRFLSIDDIRWGLREWYPVEQLEVETAPVVRARRKRRSTAVEDDEDIDDEEEVDEDGFDKIDIDEEDDDDDIEEVDGAVVVEEDEIDPDLLVEDEEEEIIPEDILLDDEDEDEEEEEED